MLGICDRLGLEFLANWQAADTHSLRDCADNLGIACALLQEVFLNVLNTIVFRTAVAKEHETRYEKYKSNDVKMTKTEESILIFIHPIEKKRYA